MAIYLTKESKVLVQGMTGGEGMKHTRRMLAAGTNVVGGVNPRKAGRTVDFDERAVPVFGSVAEGIEVTGADVTVVFVPPAFAKAAVVEASDAGIGLAHDHPGAVHLLHEHDVDIEIAAQTPRVEALAGELVAQGDFAEVKTSRDRVALALFIDPLEDGGPVGR